VILALPQAPLQSVVFESSRDDAAHAACLKAFSVLPSVAKADCRLHVCGEAYSDYQGFVEGALRSAAEMLTSPPFSIRKDDLRVMDRRLGRTRQVSREGRPSPGQQPHRKGRIPSEREPPCLTG
jgi:hypothetical protein